MRLEVENIEVSAGSFRLGPLTLTVNDGEYVIVLGPTGAGKTVTLETIAGIRMTASGRVLMGGRDHTRTPPESRSIGFLYQDSLLFPHMSVRENIAYGAHRLSRSDRGATVNRLARLLQIEPLMERMPRGLSGGERQRVALGRALAARPALLLLDEPMAALDPNTRHWLRQNLLELHRELGMTTIHVTHNFAEALAVGDRVAILIDGKLLQVGPTNEVFSNPGSAVVAHFLRLATQEAGLEPPDPDSSALALCPRELSLSLPHNGDGSMPALDAKGLDVMTAIGADETAGMIAGRVIALEERADHGVRLRLNVGLELHVPMSLNQPGAAKLVPGQSVWVRLPHKSI